MALNDTLETYKAICESDPEFESAMNSVLLQFDLLCLGEAMAGSLTGKRVQEIAVQIAIENTDDDPQVYMTLATVLLAHHQELI